MSGDNVTCILIVFPTAFAAAKGSANVVSESESDNNKRQAVEEIHELPTKLQRIDSSEKE